MLEPPKARSGAPSKEFVCDRCHIVLSRQDHLERHHATAHASPDSRNLSPCTKCDRKFSRRDVLLRHYRVVHGIQCEPRPRGRPKLASRTSSNHEREENVTGNLHHVSISSASSDGLGPSAPSLISTLPTLPESSGCDSLFNESAPFTPGFFQFPLSSAVFDIGMSTIDWMNEETMPVSVVQGSNIMSSEGAEQPHNAPTATQSYSFSPEFYRSIQTSVTSPEVPNEPAERLPISPTSNPEPPPSTYFVYTAESSALSPPVPVERCSSSDPWPLEWHASREEQRLTIPFLRSAGFTGQQEQETEIRLSPLDSEFVGCAEKLNSTNRKNIVDLLTLPFDHHPWQENKELLNLFPDAAVLDHFVQLYFLSFHEFWPVIHRPTFKVSQAPTILVLSMACIGACYSGIEGSSEFSNTIAELCRRSSVWMAEYDSRYLRSPYFAISLLLQHIHAIGSGSRRLFEIADATRSRLISTGRYMNLFEALHPPKTTSPPKENLHEAWLEWIGLEQVKRIAWFLYEFDCLYIACSKQPPSTKVEENPPELPCEQVFWEAPTAYAFAGVPWQQTPPRGLPFLHTLESLMTESGRASIPYKRLDALSKRLLVRCLGRLLESTQEQIESPFSSVLSSGAAAKAARSQISSSIMALYETTIGDMSQAINLRQTMRIAVAVHYSHMFAAGRVVDIVTRAARLWAAGHDIPTNPAQLGIGAACHVADGTSPITAYFNLDPVATREMAWHASQVFCIQRRYPLNSAFEPLSVFLAGIFLWAFSRFYVEPPRTHGDLTSIQLDIPSFSSSREAMQAGEDWIQHGGRALIEGAGNICSSGAPVLLLTMFTDMTQRLKVWGMAAKVSGVFSRMLQREQKLETGRRGT